MWAEVDDEGYHHQMVGSIVGHQKDGTAVKIGDENICDIDVECLRKEIAVVPQDSVLFHNTIKHNINYGDLKATEEAVINAAKMAEIHHSILVNVITFFKDKSVYIVLQCVICCRLGRKGTTPKLENEASNCPVVKNSELASLGPFSRILLF